MLKYFLVLNFLLLIFSIVIGSISNYTLYELIFPTVSCEGGDIFDSLIVRDPVERDNLMYLKSCQDYVGEPSFGYDITDPVFFFKTLLRGKWNGCYHITLADVVPETQEKVWVYTIHVNYQLYSVHPYLMTLLFALNGLLP